MMSLQRLFERCPPRVVLPGNSLSYANRMDLCDCGLFLCVILLSLLGCGGCVSEKLKWSSGPEPSWRYMGQRIEDGYRLYVGIGVAQNVLDEQQGRRIALSNATETVAQSLAMEVVSRHVQKRLTLGPAHKGMEDPNEVVNSELRTVSEQIVRGLEQRDWYYEKWSVKESSGREFVRYKYYVLAAYPTTEYDRISQRLLSVLEAGDEGLASLDEGLKGAANTIIEKLDSESAGAKRPVISVVPFIDNGTLGIRKLGLEAASILTRHLVELSDQRIRVTNPVQLTSLLEEHEQILQQYAKAVGNSLDTLPGASLWPGVAESSDYLVIGSTMDSGQILRVEVSVLGRGGEVLAATGLSIPKSGSLRALMWHVRRPPNNRMLATTELPPIQLHWKVWALRSQFGHSSDVIEVRDGTTLYTGDHFAIQFKPVSDCYVYAILADSDGHIESLFPYPGINISNYCRGGFEYKLPNGDFRWYELGELQETPGAETLYLVASYESIEDLDRFIEGIAESNHGKSKLSISPSLDQIMSQLPQYGTRGSDFTILEPRGVAGIEEVVPFEISLPNKEKLERMSNVMRGSFSAIKRVVIQHR